MSAAAENPLAPTRSPRTARAAARVTSNKSHLRRALLRPRCGTTRQRTLRDIFDHSQFESLLHHERARADRDDHEFSLVLIKVRPDTRKTACRLARSVIRRLRDTDEIGWYGEGCLCVLLPSTSAHGGRIFESSVKRLADAEGINVIARVFTYPGEFELPDDHSARKGPRLHREPEVHTHDASAIRPHAGATASDLMPFVLSGLVGGMETEALGMEAIETLLARPLPWWKRAIDVAASGTALLIISPLLALIAILIKCGSPGPVMFGQWRAGLGGRPFWIYKFRTMVPDADSQKAKLRIHSEQDGPAFKMKHDPRITPIGKLLRVTSLDELPQLWNVFVGDMTLVGPRPLPLDESAACKQWQKRRLDLTPGLTCIWQVKGRSRVTFIEWMRMDLAYARTRSVLADIKIIAETIPAVLLRRGAR